MIQYSEKYLVVHDFPLRTVTVQLLVIFVRLNTVIYLPDHPCKKNYMGVEWNVLLCDNKTGMFLILVWDFLLIQFISYLYGTLYSKKRRNQNTLLRMSHKKRQETTNNKRLYWGKFFILLENITEEIPHQSKEHIGLSDKASSEAFAFKKEDSLPCRKQKYRGVRYFVGY